MKKITLIFVGLLSFVSLFAQQGNFVTFGEGSYVTLDGKKYTVEGTTLGPVVMASIDNDNYALIIKNIPQNKTVNVNAKAYTNECADCVYLQLTDKQGNTYIGTSGTFTNSDKQVKFNVTMTNLLDVRYNTNTRKKIKLTGVIIKAGLPKE